MSNKEELIGKVTLDCSYAPSATAQEDAVLDELLDAVKPPDQESLDKLIIERKSWPYLYHFSSSRCNIINWYPINANAKVLEINAECGALTGTLCDKAASVHAIDPSYKKCLINAHRNQSRENLRITVVDTMEFLNKSQGKYDLITLLVNTNLTNELLTSVKTHLTSDGKIILVAENRLGLRFLSGYQNEEIHKYTKGDLTKLFQGIDITDYKFYYPYPDSTFTTTVYTDSRLPHKGDLTNNIRNFDRGRYVFWYEDPVYDDLIDENLFPNFSNSYLVVLGSNNDDNITLAKISDERDYQFRVVTKIIDSGNDRSVVKSSITSSEVNHIRNIQAYGDQLRDIFKGTADVCKSTQYNNNIEFEYIDGISYSKKLSIASEHKSKDEIIKVLDEYRALINCMKTSDTFEMRDKFKTVFGDISIPSELESGNFVDIDLIPENVIENNGKITIIDYEWVFDFGIPLEYVFWKGIFSSVAFSRLDKNTKGSIFSHYGITSEKQDLYLKMEAAFQKYVSGKSFTLRDYIEKNPFQILKLDELISKYSSTELELEAVKNELKSIHECRVWKLIKKIGLVK